MMGGTSLGNGCEKQTDYLAMSPWIEVLCLRSHVTPQSIEKLFYDSLSKSDCCVEKVFK